jgi:hypothetical protein
MNPIKLQQPSLADARIEEIRVANGELILRLLTWDEKSLMLSFKGVIAFETTGGLASDISHMTAGGHLDYVAQALEREDGNTSGVQCFAVISSWSDAAIFRVVAIEMKSQ